MQNFLEKVSRHIITRHPGNLADVCIVLPNRRAGLFLKKIIPEISGKTTWSPHIFSIEDFCVHISGYRPADPLGLLFDFYQIHCKIEGDQAQPFEEFLRWGQLLLKDINEIDTNLVDAKALFGFLSEAKAIERWTPGNPNLSELVKNYLRFYRSIYDYYLALRAKAEEKKETYMGMITRQLAETIETSPPTIPWTKIYFAGFNALTASEKKITSAMVASNVAEMLWDADDYYISDKNQEAGYFLRKEFEAEGKVNFKWVDNGFKEIPKEITICGVPKNLGQAKYAAAIIRKWVDLANGQAGQQGSQTPLTNTALVLADEKLLPQVLSSLDPNTPQFNVTMGFPVKWTQAFQFFNQLFRLYENAERFSSVDKGQSRGFYYFDILKLLQHPYLGRVDKAAELSLTIKKSKRAFYQPDQLLPLLTDFTVIEKEPFTAIFGNLSPSPAEVLEIIESLINEFRGFFSRNNSTDKAEDLQMELEYLYHFSKINLRLQGLISDYDSVKQIKTLRRLFEYIVQTTRIPFEGEPLQGLQVMGLLETRSLDFEKIILLSANEGVLPTMGFGNSFIPFDIQREFGLPVFQEKNAVFAYHFYRLLQKAKEVHLVFNTESDRLGGGEQSRFIYQLLQELPKYQPAHSIHQTVISLPLPGLAMAEEITISKENDVYSRLLEKAKTGLSPSSINLYISCPLRFYFREIVKITEADEVEETLEAQTIGSIVHKALEELFKPYISQILKPEDIADMQQNIETAIALAFEKNYPDGDTSFGWNKLLSEVIRNFVKSFLQREKEFIKEQHESGHFITLLGLEKRYETSLTLSNDEQTTVKLKGFIDRIDQLDDLIRIIDYKTGLVESRELTFASWEAFTESKKNGKAFQVLMYAWLCQKDRPEKNPRYTSGVLSMRKLSEGLMNFAIKPGRNDKPETLIDLEKMNLFEELLTKILEELFDREMPFNQTNELKTCENCEFKNMCQR